MTNYTFLAKKSAENLITSNYEKFKDLENLLSGLHNEYFSNLCNILYNILIKDISIIIFGYLKYKKRDDTKCYFKLAGINVKLHIKEIIKIAFVRKYKIKLTFPNISYRIISCETNKYKGFSDSYTILISNDKIAKLITRPSVSSSINKAFYDDVFLRECIKFRILRNDSNEFIINNIVRVMNDEHIEQTFINLFNSLTNVKHSRTS